ncbi:GNAT family N-acetyltransferase [Sorangium sp. So ce1078]|uniref:GNAT family N-acetyltransferase n=1 Tax=Sorangium sp. So ce1078 TaxID=3133329 RepID=UPI003F6320CD
MADSNTTALDEATSSDALLLSNLLELYIHDLSDVFPGIEPGADGRFGYDKLPLYWSERERRFAFIIRCAGRIAGFVLATRGSPAAEDPDVLDIAEFFVLRRYRRSGVGRRAAVLLWQRLPGKWTVRVSEGNAGALAFWRGVVSEFTNGAATDTTRPGHPSPWRVFSFESAPEHVTR